MPSNFYIIIFVQLLVLLCAAKYGKPYLRSLSGFIGISAIGGLVLGVFFDVVFGTLGVFSYINPHTEPGINAWGLSVPHLIVNGILSYGLTVATAYYITPQVTRRLTGTQKRIATAGYLGALFVCVFLAMTQHNQIIDIFLYGAVIVLGAEVLVTSLSYPGVLTSFLVYGDYLRPFRIWLCSIFIGFVYEVTNGLLPFWSWLPHSSYQRGEVEILVVVFGYVALLYPMIVLWQVLTTKNTLR